MRERGRRAVAFSSTCEGGEDAKKEIWSAPVSSPASHARRVLLLYRGKANSKPTATTTACVRRASITAPVSQADAPPRRDSRASRALKRMGPISSLKLLLSPFAGAPPARGQTLRRMSARVSPWDEGGLEPPPGDRDLDKVAWAFVSLAEDSPALDGFKVRRDGHVVSLVSKHFEEIAFDVVIEERSWLVQPASEHAAANIAFNGIIKPAVSEIKEEYDARHSKPPFVVYHAYSRDAEQDCECVPKKSYH